MAPRRNGTRTVAVTGATGCIGRMLIRHLSWKSSVRVLALIRRGSGGFERGVEVRRGDLFAREVLEALVADSDVVVHLAARNPTPATPDPRQAPKFFASNSWGTGAVAHLARAYEKPLVYTSTVTVYELGENGSALFEEGAPLPTRGNTRAWTERAFEGLGRIVDSWASGGVHNPGEAVGQFLRNDPPPPENLYGLSKFLGERWVTRTPKGLTLRLSDVYGPGHEARGILQEYLAGILEGTRVSVDFGPRARVSFVYLGDVLQALLRAAAGGGAPGASIINVAHPANVTPEHLRDELLRLGSPGTVTVEDVPPPLPGSTRPFATDEAERILGLQWTPLAKGMRETLRYLRLPPAERRAYRFPNLVL